MPVWKGTAVFVVQDDSQSGVDYVDGHRNVTLIASPYARPHSVDHTYYTQLNVTRTIEQILGLPPMNQLDLAAEPRYTSFDNTRDTTPYKARDNTTSLTTMNKTVRQAGSAIERAWLRWSKNQDFTSEDDVAFEAFNRLTWYSSYSFRRPYPGDSEVLTPAEVLAKFPATSLTRAEARPATRALAPHLAGD